MQFVLYGTSACHLCEQAEALVAPLFERLPQHSLTHDDISESDALMARYGVRIPVLRCEQTGNELGWPFDARSVSEFVERQS